MTTLSVFPVLENALLIAKNRGWDIYEDPSVFDEWGGSFHFSREYPEMGEREITMFGQHQHSGNVGDEVILNIKISPKPGHEPKIEMVYYSGQINGQIVRGTCNSDWLASDLNEAANDLIRLMDRDGPVSS
jgi:hypothetical protein